MQKLYNKHKTKRGNPYNRRRNKVADGISRTLEDQMVISKRVGEFALLNRPELTRLAVSGTLDTLGRGRWMYIKKIMVSHPECPEFKKEAYILSQKGKELLQEKK